MDRDYAKNIMTLAETKSDEIIKQREEEKKRQIELENLKKGKVKEEQEKQELRRLIEKYPITARKIIED